eukprot:365720-Chlamydomonas_euryale.AAC.8
MRSPVAVVQCGNAFPLVPGATASPGFARAWAEIRHCEMTYGNRWQRENASAGYRPCAKMWYGHDYLRKRIPLVSNTGRDRPGHDGGDQAQAAANNEIGN